MKKQFSNTISQGLLFAMLWASASVAGKYGLRSVEPLVLFNARFALAGILMLAVVYLFKSNRLPRARELKQLTIFAAFNTALYLGFFVLALDEVAAGVTALAVAMNPLFISLMTAVYTGKPVRPLTLLSIIIGLAGVGLASFPLFSIGYASWQGLVLLVLSMLAYSFGAVYYATVKWELPRMAINAWQLVIAAALLLPLTLLLAPKRKSFRSYFLAFRTLAGGDGLSLCSTIMAQVASERCYKRFSVAVPLPDIWFCLCHFIASRAFHYPYRTGWRTGYLGIIRRAEEELIGSKKPVLLLAFPI